ncbi:outer membrane beta-barrel family protein [Chitinophaga sedimenti]|uniref:outer membrane beta-barrel family protein n=1 Tax=Chitinophaga sedimenti TaxID=2033606 RepID=UPI0027E13868|nr:outer membrane beta-barrel family protein [Chitinophaga sedimenti]
MTTAANNLNRWRNGVLSTYLDRTFAGGGQLGLSADYLRYRQYNPSRMSNAYFGRNDQPAVIRDDSLQAPEHRGEGATIIQLGVLTLKYTRPLPGQLKLEAGIKGTYSSSDSRSALYSLVDGEWANRAVSSRYSMREGIGAVWISMAATINPKTSLTFGGRYEYVGGRIRSADGKEPPVARNQGNFFPNIAFTRQVNDKTDWLLSYTQRISRPSYNDLSSYLSYNDPVSVFSGNPRLRNTISHLLKFGYNYNGYAFSALTNYTRRPIVYSQAVYGPDKTLAYFTPQNLAYEGYAALQAVLPFKPRSWWNMNYTLWGGVKQLRITFTEMPVTKTYPMLTLNFSEVFILPAGFSAELSGWYTSRHYYGTIEVRGRGLMNAGLRKDLGSNHGSFNLIVTDVFRQNRNNSLFGKLTREAYGLDNDIFIYPEHTQATLAKLTYTRSFGGAQKKPREAAGDERGRVRQQ